jgi:Cu(I)-responsive transcriptional regulator
LRGASTRAWGSKPWRRPPQPPALSARTPVRAASATPPSAPACRQKTIRYYEEVGLIRPAARAGNGYRAYDEGDVHVLRFLRRARSLGFSLRDCRQLVALWQDPNRQNAKVKALAIERIAEIDRKIGELAGMQVMLTRLAEACHGDELPDSPILEDLAERRGKARDARATHA